MVEGRAGQEYATRVSQSFEPCGYIHPVAVDVSVLGNHVAEIDADAKSDFPGFRYGGLPRDLAPLHLDRTAHGLDHALKLGKQAVASRLDQSPGVSGNRRFEE